jgi:hypothetical protein
MTRLQAIQERVRRHEYDLTEPSDAAWGLYCCDQLSWLLARVEQMQALIAKAITECPVCHGDGSYWLRGPGTVRCMRCLDARAALAALDEEVPETVQPVASP